MKNNKVIDRLNQIVSSEPSKWLGDAKRRKENRDWLNKSTKIAIRILRAIRAQKETRNMSQKMLADIMGVSQQYISKIVKGQENLSLETICKLEKALGIVLIEIPKFESIQKVDADLLKETYKAIPQMGKLVSFTNKFNYSVLSEYIHPDTNEDKVA